MGAALLLGWRALVGAVLALALVSGIRRLRAWHRLRHFKGPFWAAFSRWWMLRHVGGTRMHLDLREVHDKYGPLARIGPDTLVTSDPDLLRRMLGVRTKYKRSDWYDAMRLDPTKDNVLSMRDDEKHNELRAKMAAGYSGKEVQDLEKRIDENVAALIDLIGRKYLTTDTTFRPLDFGRKAQYFTLDTISHIAFGQPFGFLATDSDVHQYIQTTEDTLPAIILLTVLPGLMKVMASPLLKSFLPSEKDIVGLGRIMGIAKQVVAKRFGPDKKVQPDMLGSFIAHGLTQSEAESETLVQILAGSDTTATAIRATLLHIISNPRVHAKLLSEITSAPPHTSRIFPDAQARRLPYLQACIKEGLRIFPPVTGLMTKDIPPDGDTYRGLHIPPGTKIGYSAFGVFRDRAIWGDDADLFRPERWLASGQGGSESVETVREREATLELVFGYGRWQCLGRNVALIELNKVFVELLRNFNLEVVDPTTPWKSHCHGIFMQSEMWLRATKREVS